MDRSATSRVRLAAAVIALALGPGAQGRAATPPQAPHQLAPDALIQPDYFTLALAHTSVADDPQWRELHLRLPPGRPAPAFAVLPVQTQGYGFSPTFRALLGARLDQELQRRHVDASRQTDIVDWRGPFARRLDDATLSAFASEHPKSVPLALYVGHDGAGHA